MNKKVVHHVFYYLRLYIETIDSLIGIITFGFYCPYLHLKFIELEMNFFKLMKKGK